ncbi:MAG: hypothetical protein ACHREM_09115 [Polyangiales bacterium]
MTRFDRRSRACVVTDAPIVRRHPARRRYAVCEAMPHDRLSAALNAELQLDVVHRVLKRRARKPRFIGLVYSDVSAHALKRARQPLTPSELAMLVAHDREEYGEKFWLGAQAANGTR